MTKEDVYKLFSLLDQLYQGKRKPRDEVTAAIWAKVLEPWSYAQVREAAIQRARTSRYFPDPSELAQYLPQVVQEEQRRRSPPPPSALRAMENTRKWAEDWDQELKLAGIPTLHEALAQGMTLAQWRLQLEELEQPHA